MPWQQTFEKASSFPLNLSQVPRQLSGDILTCVYRVSQENLQNIAKHARATAINCVLKGEAAGLRLTIQDNGRGFTRFTNIHFTLSGLGLVNMKERARALHGRLTIESHPEKGTAIDLWLPWEEEKPST